MSQSTFSLTCDGSIHDGFDTETVRNHLTTLLDLTEEQQARLFGGAPVVLRNGLSEENALRYCARLNAIGLRVTMQADSDDTATIPPAKPPVSTGANAERALQPFEFHGKGSEFFRIWIVNILLSIITLGIYSAWAKVRTHRYFYGNTRLAGSSFEYLATPLQILKGRAIAFALFLLYSFAGSVSPIAGLAALVVLLLTVPWIVRQSLRFRNHNSAWRDVRFSFHGSLGDAYKAWLMWPLLGLFSFGLLMPFAIKRMTHYAIDNARFGGARFAFDGPTRRIYLIFGAAALTFVGVAALGVLSLMTLDPLVLPAIFMMLAYLLTFSLAFAWITNWRFNHARLEHHRFEADYRTGSYAALVFTNTLATLLTLGLFYPWAKVRTARYAAEHTRVLVNDNLSSFVAEQHAGTSATGGELGEFFDINLGF